MDVREFEVVKGGGRQTICEGSRTVIWKSRDGNVLRGGWARGGSRRCVRIERLAVVLLLQGLVSLLGQRLVGERGAWTEGSAVHAYSMCMSIDHNSTVERIEDLKL